MEQDGERTPLTATQTPAHHPPPPRRRARRRGNQSSYSATREVAGAFLVACSAACFSMMALLVRVGVVFKENRFASFQLVLSRSLFQFFAASIVLLWIKKDPLGPPDMRIWLVIRALAGGFGVVCLFYSLSLLSLGECTVLIFTMPIFTLIFSRIFLGEKVEVVDGFFGVLCLCGIALVAKPHLLFAHEVTHEMKKRLFGTGAAILAALAQASIYIVIKKMGVSVHYMMNVMYLGILGIVLAPIGTDLRTKTSQLKSRL
uniref:EamA domain-containing protein n=1 Tax=Rhodosorus marinus TaxID=101924 RepID=A0A7S2ZLY8_9RHOD|mmetsp:Transcript_22957/g.91850  ORF Transcript_22957/g.91850 Transcript_22957/m.91850 type:complete len:259 (+) Transcript_22957:248-1024(+)